MTEQAFLASALEAIRVQQIIIERCSSNIARTLQENADAFAQMRASIATLNEMVSSVQAVARLPRLSPGKKRRVTPVVEIPVSRSTRMLLNARPFDKGADNAETSSAAAHEPRLGSGSSDALVEAVVGDGRTVGRGRRSDTPTVQPRKKRKQIEMGFDFGCVPHHPAHSSDGRWKMVSRSDCTKLTMPGTGRCTRLPFSPRHSRWPIP